MAGGETVEALKLQRPLSDGMFDIVAEPALSALTGLSG
jgi:hypothetical protein